MPDSLLLSDTDKNDILKLFNGMKGMYSQLDADVKAGKPLGEIKTHIDKVSTDIGAIQEKYTALVARADAAEAKAVDLMRRVQAGPEVPKGLGELAIADESFLNYIKNPPPRLSFTTIIKGKTFADLLRIKVISGIGPMLPETAPGIANISPRLPIGVRTLIPGGRTSAGAYEYLEETSFTNNAAPVLEGAKKPESTKVYTPRTANVRTIAHFFKVTKQALADVPGLQASIENNGIFGVQVAEDDQLLNGDGVAPNLLGYMVGAQAAPVPAAPAAGGPENTVIDAIGAAAFDLASKGYLPDGAVVNPADWGAVSLLKNSQGNYLFANPIDTTGIARIWGMRLVQSHKMGAGNFLVGAFQGNSLLLDREDVNVLVATQNEDDFVKNIVTVLIEERVVNIIYQPKAFEKGVVPV